MAAIRHKLRSASEFGRHHLHLNDNTGAVLLCSKGRSGTFGMLRISRRIAALVLAADISFHCRWIPSELNHSDKASRRWEHLRVSNAEGRARQEDRKKEIADRCYPRIGQQDDALPAGSWRSVHRHFVQKESIKKNAPDQGREEVLSTGEVECQEGQEAIQGSNQVGATGSFSAGGAGLSEAGARVETFRQAKRFEPISEEQLRHGLLQVCQQHVRSRIRPSGRDQKPGSHHRCLSRLWPKRPTAQNSTSFAGMVEGRSSKNASSNSMASSGHSAPHVHRIPQAWRGLGSSENRPCSTNAKGQAFCTPSTSSRTSSAIQGGTIRRKYAVGLASASMVRQGVAKHIRTNLSTGHLIPSSGEALEEQLDGHGIGPKPLCSLPTSTFRAKPRSSPSTKISTRGETKRKMGLRCNSQKVRGSCQNQSGVLQPSFDCSTTLSPNRTSSTSSGPKIFQPSKLLSARSRTIVIELFSGCARLSRACARHGFQVYA